jgi:hypothetical protein
MRGLLVTVGALCLSLSACSEPEDGKLRARLSGAGAEESFVALYEEIFVPHGCVDCHDDDAPGGLAMTDPQLAHAQLVGVAATGKKCEPVGSLRVDPGNADASLLIHKLEGHDDEAQPVCGNPMPIKTNLEPDEIARIRAWIDQGAPNN